MILSELPGVDKRHEDESGGKSEKRVTSSVSLDDFVSY